MKVIRRAALMAAIGGLLASAGVALAVPASADLVPGSYDGTVIDGGSMYKSGGALGSVTITPCGPGCLHYDNGRKNYDLRLQDNVWSGTHPFINGKTCTTTVDNATLVETLQCGIVEAVTAQLVKNP